MNVLKERKYIFKYNSPMCPIFLESNGMALTGLCLEGSDFQKKVWEILLTIPYGKTMTYGKIAEQIAMQKGIKKMSAQAVGGAVGRNPVSMYSTLPQSDRSRRKNDRLCGRCR